jgi:hypothetical protein
LGFPLPHSLAISDGKFGIFSSTAVPQDTCAPWVHPLVRFAPLQSTSVPRSAKSPRASSAFLGVAVPHRDINQLRPSFELPTARHLAVLGVSHAPDGFLRCWPCGFISPHCHVQGSLFRGLLLVRSRIAFQRSLPSRRCPDLAKGSCPPSPLRRSSPSGLSSASESVTL